MKNIARWLMVSLAIVSLAGCGGCPYSFTGSSVPPHLKTIGISLFDDQSGFGEPNLRENFTNKLISLFQQDNSLEVADKTHADSVLEGIIASVRDDPSVVSAGEMVTKRRVTISVKVTYQDMKLRKRVWEREFSNWGDYVISSDLAQRTTAISDAIQKLGEDILNATVSGW